MPSPFGADVITSKFYEHFGGIFEGRSLLNFGEGPKWPKAPNLADKHLLGPQSSGMTLLVPSEGEHPNAEV